MTNDEIVDALLQQKEFLEDHESELLAKCQTDAERLLVRMNYQRARDQWNEAVNKTLCMDDALMRGLLGDLSDVQEDVRDLVAKDAGLERILNRITDGVAIGAKILTLLK